MHLRSLNHNFSFSVSFFAVCLLAAPTALSANKVPAEVSEKTRTSTNFNLAQAQEFQDQEFDQDNDFQNQDFGQDQGFQDQEFDQDDDFQNQDFGQDQGFQNQDFQDQDVGQGQDFQDQNIGQDQDVQNQNVGQRQPVGQTAVGGAGLRQEALAAHNRFRVQHCVPPLAWSSRLANTAQDWANRCEFVHSTNGLGENLAIGTTGAFPPAAQVRSWYDEINDYDFANGQSRTGQAVGHFTQVVWRNTTQVGCGVATCQGQDLLVCNYSPAGNFRGQYVQNVPQRCR